MQRRAWAISAAVLLPLLLVGGLVLGLIVVLVGGQDKALAACAADNEMTPSIVDVSSLPGSIDGYGTAQLANAAIIVDRANRSKLPTKAAQIAVMTAMQESGLRLLANDGSFSYPAGSRVMSKGAWDTAREVVKGSLAYPHQGVGADWDSIGLFQQRPSAGWGSVEQLMDASYNATKFYSSLEKISGWQDREPWAAAQAVQRSAFPGAYQKHWATAKKIVQAVTGAKVTLVADPSSSEQRGANATDGVRTQTETASSSAGTTETASSGGASGSAAPSSDAATDPALSVTSCDVASEQAAQLAGGYEATVTQDGWTRPIRKVSALTGTFGDSRGRYPHAGQDFAAPRDTPIYAAADGKVIRSSCTDLVVGRSPCEVQIDHGTDSSGQRISTLYVHMYPDGLVAKLGDSVKAGDLIARVGSNGNSTGNHLHFEVWKGKTPVEPLAFLREHGVSY